MLFREWFHVHVQYDPCELYHEYSSEILSNYQYYHIISSYIVFRAYTWTKMAANPRAQQLGSYSASMATSSMSNMFSQLVITGHKYVMEGMKNYAVHVGPKVSHSSLSIPPPTSLSLTLTLIHSLPSSTSISNIHHLFPESPGDHAG